MKSTILDLTKYLEIDSRIHMEVTFLGICRYILDKKDVERLRKVLVYSSYPDEYKHIEDWLNIKNDTKFKKYLSMVGSEYNRFLHGG